jgi:hypothetical protein
MSAKVKTEEVKKEQNLIRITIDSQNTTTTIIINASRGIVHQYENVKRKLFNSNANIYFNRHCHEKSANSQLRQDKDLS